MSVIDLDEAPVPAVRPPGYRPRRWRRVAIAAALLLVGALVGGFVTYAQVAGRQAERSNSTVSVLVLATVNPAASGAPRRVGESAVADVQVTIVNTGPAAINFASLSEAHSGVTLSVADKQRWIEPGTSTPADAVMTVSCAEGYPPRDLAATLSVVTLDGASRQSPVTIATDPWNDQLDGACGSTH